MKTSSRGHKMLAPWRWPAAWVHTLALLALLAWTALECFGPLPSEAIAASTFDKMQQHRLWASAPDSRILIVDIDERSLADMAPEFGRWPWSRDTLAAVLAQAQAEGAAAVVFDILFSDPDRLQPGGDRALEVAVRSGHGGFFPVARLPAALDSRSELRADQVPGLFIPPPMPRAAPRVALILPFMHAMVESRQLGTHTANLDSDGKLRRFAFSETLAGGWTLDSMPSVVARRLGVTFDVGGVERLIVWRKAAEAYPRVPFSEVWQCADGRKRDDCPALAGRILVLGATASSLHDLKATPLASQHMGVDILATLIDNALHQRSYRELPTGMRWVLSAAALLLAGALVRRGGAGSTGRALWALPLLLLAIGYASLHSESFYLDLSLPAAAALAFLGAVKLHDELRRRMFGLRLPAASGTRAMVCGCASGNSEQLERNVFDFAANHKLAVSGSKALSGVSVASDSLWVLWGFTDAASSRHAAQVLAASMPLGWYGDFEVATEPQRDLFAAIARALPATHQSSTAAPKEPTHALV